MARYRTEKDSLGTFKVPANALYGAQTARALENFPISGRPLQPLFIRSLASIKYCAAAANAELGVISSPQAKAIQKACRALMAGKHSEQFPVDVFQTGSGTSTNMNMNEVIARLASQALKNPINPNDHVNASQSSNDTIPSCIHLSVTLALESELLPALIALEKTLKHKGKSLRQHIKTGRTHLMDALPLRFDQEFATWAYQVEQRIRGLRRAARPLRKLVQGGSAIGTGVNVPKGFTTVFFRELNQLTGLKFKPSKNCSAGMAAQDDAVAFSGELRTLAVTLMKIANDLRWMNSGPNSGLGEVELPALQPGSSIMPGKVNPVIPEAVCMVAAEVMGNDAAIAIAGQSGNFQLNVMLPLIAYNLHESIRLLGAAARLLDEKAIAGLEVREEVIKAQLASNPMLVTALAPRIGYSKSAAIAQMAYKDGRPILEVAREQTDLAEAELIELLNPANLTV